MNEQESVHEEHGNCQHLLSSICDYVDGDLAPELCTELERHLKDCPTCRVVVDTTRKTIELYQATAQETDMPEDVRERLYLRLNIADYLK